MDETHPSSMTTFVNLFKRSVIQKITIVSLNTIFSIEGMPNDHKPCSGNKSTFHRGLNYKYLPEKEEGIEACADPCSKWKSNYILWGTMSVCKGPLYKRVVAKP
jgi:hypothetical protein